MSQGTINLAQELTAHITTKFHPPSNTWLSNFLFSIRPNTPLPALKQTALFRLLAADITQTISLSQSSVFPPDIQCATIRERRLAGPIPVQILDVEDIGRSRWSQIEAIEAAERGETTKGREIIRVVPDEQNQVAGENEEHASTGPHKLLLQDAQGTRVYGMELVSVDGVSTSMYIGAKMLLRDVVVARGVLLLEPRSAQVIGGKIDALHKAWREERKERLKAAITPAET